MTSGADDALAAHELDLVTRAAQGDDAAFDRFYEKNAPAVQLLAERLLGPGAAADGVVVEAFEKTVRRLPLLGPRNSSPALYVLSTARNGAYAALGRERPVPPAGPLGALLALPSRQRELLALREVGLSEAQCAEVAGIDAGEVGVQVARARLRMTDELEGLGLSAVFADDRAERLLAAEVVRTGGGPLPSGLEDEITKHADEDSRFAAALSAVRSPSRSVGQLPPVGVPSRLLGEARSHAVGAGRPLRSAAAGGGAAGASARASAARATTPPAAPRVAPGAGSQAPAASPEPAGPAAPRLPAKPGNGDSARFDDTIGDEFAWGIVDDEASAAPPPEPGAPAVSAPTDGQWEDGAGRVSREPAAPIAGAGSPPLHSGTPSSPGTGDPALNDPFAGWDDVDWPEDERDGWTAGPAARDKARGDIVAPPPPAPAARTGAGEGELSLSELAALGATRPFDAVETGLAEGDDGTAVMGVAGVAASDEIPPFEVGAIDEPRKRSKWRFLMWLLVFVALGGGAALATYAIFSARQDPDLPPASVITQTTPKSTSGGAKSTATPKPSSTKKKTTGSSSKTSSSGSSSGSASSGSSGGASSTASSGGTSNAGTAASGGTTTRPTGTATTGGTSTKPKATPDGQVTAGGDATSGGSVRGGDATGSTTP